ncbi:RagB/SusD family nutrient uptake outer membrane protein [Pedobacter sp. MC2016-24]|uniref:RagB/SusD family nutrient uptake outer membrane protein n=1 Tax=Pedobacter sp. MC2016-24 TaxID=2780090 RepID=UPI001880DAA0|nr:RagB/SusD family nutrient uptake outer membrane protein [Pedobacter sp. MC2016-24]MBE9599840.1 RagB/SusD family nutrient uptake outer membrane protein [Pedobacter sp. MC2016-24]
MKFYSNKLIVFFGCCFAWMSCNKLVEIPQSKNQIENTDVFRDSTLATSALLGAYFTMGTTVYGGIHKNLNIYADEYNYTASTGPIVEFNKSQLGSGNSTNSSLWNGLYLVIYQCNSLMEGLEHSTGVKIPVKEKLIAEAKFLRAYANFYLVNLYEHVPLILTTEVNGNARAAQVPESQVYEQIEKDLLDASAILKNQYAGTGKVRANKQAADALLARAFLFERKWTQAVAKASEIINSNQYTPLPKPEDVFLANSKETILQFWAVNGFVSDATQFIPVSATVQPTYTISTALAASFENTDSRKSKWITSNNVTVGGITTPYSYPSKYKNRTANTTKAEYVMALRLSEQLLIRAEAFAQLKDVPAAIADLNIIRMRGGLLPLSNTLSEQECLDAITKERRIEFFGEWGHRFFDLKRTGQLDAVMEPLKTTWKTSAKVLPIPNSEIAYNSNLKQNEDY